MSPDAGAPGGADTSEGADTPGGPEPNEVPPQSLRLVRVEVPLVSEHLAAHGVERRRDVILVSWTAADGTVGWGECPTLSAPGYATETTEVAWAALVELLGPAALGRPAVDGDTPLGVVAAPAALRDARLDAALRRSGVSLRGHLRGTRPTLGRCAVLADLGADPQHTAQRAALAIQGGADMVKVKIAPGHDLTVLREVMAAVAPAPVAADCNGSYADPSELAAVDALGLRYLEQPFDPALGWVQAADLHRQLETSVALDEPLVSVDAVVDAVRAGAADVVSVKPARLGGVMAARDAVDAAVAGGVDCFVGGMLELGIGRAAAAAVASLPGCTLPTDLGPSDQYVSADICEPILTDRAGRLVVPDGPGIGRAPDESMLAACTVDEVVLE